MSEAIHASGIGKRYRLGARQSYGALRDVIGSGLRAPFRRRSAPADGDESGRGDVLWALRDVSFDVAHGEVVGIVGRNGSGKSTLLKILSRITEPTTGRARVRGRVGSLLEVGTGFHPELSGRENVFVNGAILGMPKREIARKFDEIVAFAGVDRFIDTPVKHYSSGMQMRLAFAVAAHLEPHILLVDEVLAVGDAEFQRKCLGKMKDVSLEGRTVLLVSHQMGQIRRLCKSVLWLDGGEVRAYGPTAETIRAYETAAIAPATGSISARHCFQGWSLGDGGHVLTDTSRPFVFRVDLGLVSAVTSGHFGISLLGDDDGLIAGWAFEPVDLPAGLSRLDVTLPQLPIRPGIYRISLALFDRGNNLTGGRLVEKWTAAPALAIDVPPVGHPQDEWAGVLNLAATLKVSASARRPQDSAVATAAHV